MSIKLPFHQYHWNHLEKGSVIVVELGAAADVRLMDSSNFNAYKNGCDHRIRGWRARQTNPVSDGRSVERQLVRHDRPPGAKRAQREVLGQCVAFGAPCGSLGAASTAVRYSARAAARPHS